MNKEEIKNKMEESYLYIQKLKRELRDLELVELEAVKGNYYYRVGYEGIIIGKVIGLSECSYSQLSCKELTKSLDGKEFNFWYTDVILSDVENNWITKEEFNKYKKDFLNEINIIF